MPKKQPQPADFSDKEQESLVHLGKMMSDPRDDFDHDVEAHLAELDASHPHEAGYQKMRAAETGSNLGLGPTEMEAAQVKQQGALQQQASTRPL